MQARCAVPLSVEHPRGLLDPRQGRHGAEIGDADRARLAVGDQPLRHLGREPREAQGAAGVAVGEALAGGEILEETIGLEPARWTRGDQMSVPAYLEANGWERYRRRDEGGREAPREWRYRKGAQAGDEAAVSPEPSVDARNTAMLNAPKTLFDDGRRIPIRELRDGDRAMVST